MEDRGGSGAESEEEEEGEEDEGGDGEEEEEVVEGAAGTAEAGRRVSDLEGRAWPGVGAGGFVAGDEGLAVIVVVGEGVPLHLRL